MVFLAGSKGQNITPDPLWPWVVVPDRVQSMGQTELKYVLMLNWIVWNSTDLYKIIFVFSSITDADYADDIVIRENTPNQSEILLHSLEEAPAGIFNAHKTEYMCFNQTGDFSALGGSSLKLVDKFTYLGSSVLSTEKDIGTRLTKAWTAINKLSII